MNNTFNSLFGLTKIYHTNDSDTRDVKSHLRTWVSDRGRYMVSIEYSSYHEVFFICAKATTLIAIENLQLSDSIQNIIKSFNENRIERHDSYQIQLLTIYDIPYDAYRIYFKIYSEE